MKKKIIIIVLIFIIGIGIFSFIKLLGKNINSTMEPISITYEENTNQKEEEEKKISEIVEEKGLNNEKNLYEIRQEYDGREVVVIKNNVKFNVALAGIIKNEKPKMEEIQETLKKAPNHTGIWISSQSKDKFFKVLKNITKAEYEIDEDGFLHQNNTSQSNEQDKKINNLLNDGKLYIFDICSITYIIDEVTGNIEEYPFEEMDPYLGNEYLEDNNKNIFIISENKLDKISQEDVLRDIFAGI